MVCLKCDHKRPKVPNASGTCTGEFEGSIGKSTRRDRKQSKDSDRWRFVHEYNEDEECLDSRTENSKFTDFPITRSRTTWSFNTGKCESTLEMEAKNKSLPTVMQNDGSKCTDSQRKLELLECSDDEEMSGWFRRR